MRTLFTLLVGVGILAAAGVYYLKYIAVESPPEYKTATVKRGDLTVTINATGTLQPEEVVDVGAQVAGRILKFGPDPATPSKMIDFTSAVQEGTLLAEIDQTVYLAQRDQAKAQLLRAKADLLQLQAKLEQAEEEWKRAESLMPKNAIAETDYILAKANFRAAKANVAVGEATIQQSEAALKLAETNLEYTTIKSPVKGEIIARRVNIGQTVVASLNAPSLFLIGKDLTRMQVWAQVNEADIGRIHIDTPARFTVDAFPNDVFVGKVIQIRLYAQSTQNVVLYPVVVATDNSNRKLLPYLTANLKFEVDRRSNVLLVPNAALRWKPRSQQQSGGAGMSQAKGFGGKAWSKGGDPSAKAPGAPGDAKSAPSAREKSDRGRLWVQDEDGELRSIEVQIGATDGAITEVSGNEELKEGMEIVIGEVPKQVASSETTNPFAPPKFRGGKQQEQKAKQ